MLKNYLVPQNFCSAKHHVWKENAPLNRAAQRRRQSTRVGGWQVSQSDCRKTHGHVRAVRCSIYLSAMTLEIIELEGKQIQMTLLRPPPLHSHLKDELERPLGLLEHVCDITHLGQSLQV